jgi:pimeloyl-ACP methyl ester carboxylesterase
LDGAEYFSKLISDSNLIIFDDCGHFISYEKPKETAKNITNFLDLNSYYIIEAIE